jgi:hypothetical protein
VEIREDMSSVELKRLRQALDDRISVARCNEEGHPQNHLRVKSDGNFDDRGLPSGRPGLPVAVECARCGMQWPVADAAVFAPA